MSGQWWWILAMVLGAAGVALLGWALFWDRSRGRRRCPKCWYDMAGVPGLVCPECGRNAKGERGLGRTRRRWVLAAAGAGLICLAWPTALINTHGREGWWAYMPTAVLLLADQRLDPTTPIGNRLVMRLGYGVNLPWDRWLARRIEASRMPADWTSVARHRARWPVGVPLRVEIGDEAWLRPAFETFEVSMWSSLNRADKALAWYSPPQRSTCGFGGRPPYWLELPPPKPGPNVYDLVLEVRADGGFVAKREVAVQVEGVGTIDEAIRPFMPTGAECMAGRLLVSLYQPRWDRLSITFEHNASNYKSWGSRRHSRRFRATLLYAGEPLAVLETASSEPGTVRLTVDLNEAPWPALVDGGREALEVSGLSVRIEPDPGAAVMDLYFDAYSAEAFEAPLSSLWIGSNGDWAGILPPSSMVPIEGFKRESPPVEYPNVTLGNP